MANFNVILPKCDVATRQPILSVADGTAVTTNGTCGPFPVDFFSSAGITTAVTTCSGSILFYLQKQLGDGTFDDIACITSLTSSIETKTLSFVNGGNNLNVQSNQNLAANTVLTVNFGAYWRLAWRITTSASTFSFSVWGDFFA